MIRVNKTDEKLAKPKEMVKDVDVYASNAESSLKSFGLMPNDLNGYSIDSLKVPDLVEFDEAQFHLQ